MSDIIDRIRRVETTPLHGTEAWVRLWEVLQDARSAIVSLRAEVRTQRQEIAALREERAALVAADRPQIDSIEDMR